MPLQHKLSEAMTMRLDVDTSGTPVLEIEFKFIRYRLTLDDEEKISQMQDLLKLVKPKQKNIKGEVTMPRFYGGRK